MLIQRGKSEGWLHLDVGQTQEWARLSGITFHAASARRIPGRGIGLTADRDLTAPVEVLSVADDLVLSVDTIKQHARFDSDFRELFDSLGASATVGVPIFLSAFTNPGEQPCGFSLIGVECRRSVRSVYGALLCLR